MLYMLDTSFCVALLRKKTLAERWAGIHSLPELTVSTVVEMKLRIGILAADDPTEEQSKVERLLQVARVVTWDSAAASATAAIYHLLSRQGKLAEAADTFIAGHALSLGYTLVTADAHLLKRAPAIGLKVEDYRAAIG